MATLLFFQCRTGGSLKMACVVRHEVGQLAVLGMAPPRLDGVQFRSVGWQPLKINAFDSRCCDSLGSRTMDRPTIPADDQRTLVVFAKLCDKGHNLVGANVVVVNLKRRTDVSPRGRESDSVPMTLRRSYLSQARCTGVSPQGTQVRRFTGCSRNPVSSIETMLAPRRRFAFF